jgi:hypothetical protein
MAPMPAGMKPLADAAERDGKREGASSGRRSRLSTGSRR